MTMSGPAPYEWDRLRSQALASLKAEWGLQRTGSWRWLARCPAHGGSERSLSISREDERLEFHCHAQDCGSLDILAALGCVWQGRKDKESFMASPNIRFVTGNLFDAGCEALVNPVNCVGVMGKGLALQFKQRFPDNYLSYRTACENGAIRPGQCHVFENDPQHMPRWIVNFPTKRHWRDPSRLEDIAAGLDTLVGLVRRHGMKSLAVPPLGCGLGGLPWPTVRTLMLDSFKDVQASEILIYGEGCLPAAGIRRQGETDTSRAAGTARPGPGM